MQRWNLTMGKATDMKQAKVYTFELDKERKATFDFNALVELSEFYDDPYSAMDLLEHANPKVLRAMVYSMLVAGEKIKDEDAELDLSLSQVGHMVGKWFRNKDKLADAMKDISESVQAFFLEEQDDEKTDEKKSKTDAGKAEKN
jgi:hypothetical protein